MARKTSSSVDLESRIGLFSSTEAIAQTGRRTLADFPVGILLPGRRPCSAVDQLTVGR
jgi:hypothetical protein